jgi:hypothetical protein
MSTSAGGSSLAKRDNVALATARRARIKDARNPLSPTTIRKTCFLKQVFFRLQFMRMSTSAGGSSLAKRDNVALATARRARIKDACNPLSPTTIRKTCFLKQVFFRLQFMRMSTSSLRPASLYGVPQSAVLVKYIYPLRLINSHSLFPLGSYFHV